MRNGWIGAALAGGLITGAMAEEALVLNVSGSFEARPGAQYNSAAQAFYDVSLPARGWFRSEVDASPGIFGGPSGNSEFYHFSTQLDRVGDVTLTNFTTTDIESPPVTTMRNSGTTRLIETGGVHTVRVLGPYAISFTFGDFLFGDAQDFTARGHFDPSPVAEAGPTVVVEAGAAGKLFGSGSDLDDDALTYVWARVSGPSLGISSTTDAQPTFTAPNVTQPTTARYQLIVSDANSASLPDTVDVLIYPPGGNIPPLVDAGPGDSGDFFTTLMLDGLGSTDFDGVVSMHSWTQIGGPRVALSDPASATPTFKQYDPARFNQTYTFELVVSDGLDLSAKATTAFAVSGYGMNAVPLGPNETLIFSDSGAVPMVPQNPPGSPATVDFAGIDVPGPGRLRTEVLGTPGLFGGPDGNNPNFHLSSHGSAWDGLGTTNFQQTDIESPPVIANTFFVDAGGGTRLLTVIGPQALSFTFLDFLFGDAQSFDVNVWFRPQSQTPIADAGPDQVMESAMVVQLDGRGSTDPDGDPLSYLWTQISGPGVTLSNVNSPVPLFKTPIVSANTDVEFSLTVNDGVVSTPDTVIVTITPPLGGPELVAATVAEINTLDLMLQAGDRIFLTFDQPVNVPTTNVQDAHFTITTAGTTFSGSTIRNSLRDPKTLVIQLGFSSSGIVVGGAGVGSTALGILPSGGLAITNPLTSLPAVVTTPGEEIDLRWRYLGVPGMIGPAGGVVGVDPDVVNYELTQLGLTIPAGALAAETEFELRSVPSALEGLGLPTAIHITTDAADPVNLFQIPATLTLQYRDFDIDFRAGQIEGLMRVFQLTSGGPVSLEQSGVSGARLRPLTNGTQDGGANTVQVQLDGLDPGDTGTVGTFATLPVNPVEERSILIKPSGAAGGAAVLTLPGAPALSPEGNSGYLLHTIEFPGYEAATIEDDDRIQATLRAATLFDRTAIMLSNTSFPAQSGAVFVIETKDATGFPVSFTDPVNLEVEFMDRGDPTLTDTVELTGAQGLSLQMRLVRSATATADGANFALFGGAQAVDLGSSLVTESGVTPLTDANGLAVWGAAVDPLVSLPSVDDLLDHILGITELTGDDLMNADLNGDGEVDAADVVSLVGN